MIEFPKKDQIILLLKKEISCHQQKRKYKEYKAKEVHKKNQR